ncbi:unnamed protein product [Amoebophrya sp. A120]|nr:unnamed protein product [Amoebophrya sp. A120]|eukprot:GSA120T00008236001.1
MQKQAVENSYVLAPEYKNKFRQPTVKEILKEILNDKLQGVTYHAEGSNVLAKQVADEIKERLRDEQQAQRLDSRYKIVTQVFILEQRGQGVRIGHRAFWDEETDSFATESFSNDHIFCVATAYGIYFY